MKFSVFTVGTPDLTISDAVNRIKKHGYHAVEWRVSSRPKAKPDPLPPQREWYWTYNQCTLELNNIAEEAKMVKKLCDEAELEISSLSTYLRPGNIGEIAEVAKAAKSINCPRIRIMAPDYVGEEDYTELFSLTQEQLASVEHVSKEHGVKMVLEIHHNNLIPSASAAYRLLSPFDSQYLGVIYDPGNMVHEGYEQYTMGINILGDYLDHVHIKDARPVFNGKDTGWTIEWCPVGEGMVDFAALLATLKSMGYTGYLSSEDFSNEHGTEEKLAHNIAYLKALLAEQ